MTHFGQYASPDNGLEGLKSHAHTGECLDRNEIFAQRSFLRYKLVSALDRIPVGWFRNQVHRTTLLLLIAVLSAVILSVASIVLVNARSSNRLYPITPTEQLQQLDEASGEVAATLPLFKRLDDNYARGCEPAQGGIRTLARLGVRTIIDLRSSYDLTVDIGVAAERAGLSYYWMPTSVWNPPTDAEAGQFVSIVADKSKGPFFVFCADGLNRTGEMSALYRVAVEGWAVEKALKEMDDLGFSPHYYTIRNYIWTYARKHRPEAVPKEGRALTEAELEE